MRQQGRSANDVFSKRVIALRPYGICDIAANTGWVTLGITSDTAALAVERSGAGGVSSTSPAIAGQNGC